MTLDMFDESQQHENCSSDLSTSSNQELTTVDKWKQELKSELESLCKSFHEYKAAKVVLEGYIKFDRHALYAYEPIENFMNEWIKTRCSDASKKAKNIGHLSIKPDGLPSEISNFEFPRARGFYDKEPEFIKGKDLFTATVEEFAEWAINNYDFEALQEALQSASENIEVESFKSAANKLASAFGLCRRFNDNIIHIKKAKGRFILEMSYYGSWRHDRVRSLRELIPPVRTFQNESDSLGLDYCIQQMINMEEGQPGIDPIVPSRTKVAKDEPVEAVFYNEKIKFHFEPEIFEAFISFIQEYGDSSKINEVKVQ